MIVVKLIGGLGNQMFQYAAGRRAALKANSELKLDPRKAPLRKQFELEPFNIVDTLSSKKEVDTLAKYNLFFWNRTYFRESKNLAFYDRILNIKGNAYLDGYWQNPRYFADVAREIRRDFQFKKEPNGKNRKLKDDILKSNAVAIHVRRTDYVENRTTHNLRNTFGIEYYKSAVELITSKVSRPKLYIFSDEPEWVKKNLTFNLPTVYVDHNDPLHGYEDLRLMTLCKHNIIANSTFSWWGAWLNPNKRKIVVAPKKWYNDITLDSSQIIPQDWIQI